MKDNWYLVLELDFDPALEDENVIANKIDEKAKFWASKFNDYKMGAQYRTWSQKIPQIRKDMIGPDNIRKQLVEEAQKEVYEPIDKLLRNIGRKGNITSAEAEKISAKSKISIDIIKKRAEKLGIKYELVANDDSQAIYDKYYKNKPASFETFENLKGMLASFSVATLYEFLFPDDSIKNAKDLPCDVLSSKAIEKKKTEFYKNDSISGTGAKLCGQCALVFKDSASKKTYDDYLDYVNRKSILDDAKNVADISGSIDSNQCTDYINRLISVLHDDKTAEKLFFTFCKTEKIIYSSNQNNQVNKNIKVCKCGCINDVSDGRKVCQSCGRELTVICPNCGAANDSIVQVCKCGFRFENLDKAVALCEQADYASKSLDFKSAELFINEAKKLCPKGKEILNSVSIYNLFIEKSKEDLYELNDCIQQKRFLSAKAKYDYLRQVYPEYKNMLIASEIENAISDANDLYKTASGLKTEADVIALGSRIYSTCVDFPGIKKLLEKYPPQPVRSYTVTSDSFSRLNRIQWIPAVKDSSYSYIVVRSQNGWVQTPADGQIVYEGKSLSYSDVSIEPAQRYYYNIFAQRAGILSKGSQNNTDPVVNFFEIRDVSVKPGDASLGIEWTDIPASATVELYQLDPEKYIGSIKSNGYVINGLRNDCRYQFRIALSYLFDGEKKESAGIKVEGIPVSPTMPIDTITVRPLKNNMYEAIWYKSSNTEEVKLYASISKPKYNLRDIIPLNVLNNEYMQLQTFPLSEAMQHELGTNKAGVLFEYSGSELIYVIPVVVKSGSGIFGSLASAGKFSTVNVKSIRQVNGKICITIDPIKDATGYIVLYRHDQFPIDIDDTKTIRKYIPEKIYRLTNDIEIDGIESKKYYFSIFAEFIRNDEKIYSVQANYLFDNSPKKKIYYSIRFEKKIFGENKLVLEFRSDDFEFSIPAIVVSSSIGNVPLTKSHGSVVQVIPSQPVNGVLRIEIPMAKKTCPPNMYIKAFLDDESSNFQLALDIKSNYKIA